MSKAEVVTNHIVIAEYAGIERTSLRLLINKHKKDFDVIFYSDYRNWVFGNNVNTYVPKKHYAV